MPSATVVSRLSRPNAKAEKTAAATSAARKIPRQSQVHQGMGLMLSLTLRRGVEQSGSSPGS